MSQNVGNTDKYVRTILGVALAIAAFGGFLQGTTATAAVFVAVVLLLTAWAKFCPLYALLGLNTCPRKQKT